MSLIKDIIVALKGFGMGAANVIPGVSGGTIALLTGIFGRIIECLNSLMEIETWKLILKGQWKEFWKKVDGRFLVALFIGVVASIFSLARLMEYVLNYYPVQTWAFFFGMIAASGVVMLMGIKGWKAVDVLWAVLGLVLGVLICTLSPTTTPDDLWFIAIIGAIAICTMILPGVSGSFILLIFGKYEYIMNAVNEMNIPVLIALVIGCGVGILAFSKFLHWLLARFERQTMLVLLGFVIGSLVRVWPWSDPSAIIKAQLLQQGAEKEAAREAVAALVESGQNLEPLITDVHYLGAVLFAFVGIAVVGALEYFGNKKEA
ncbi:MAG: DUF368 domain-containing protein [Bacteroidales bacterium]|nr:DUF368 domain-containing protein [Bacteroidales bacterium]